RGPRERPRGRTAASDPGPTAASSAAAAYAIAAAASERLRLVLPGVERKHRSLRVLYGGDLAGTDVHRPHQLAAAELRNPGDPAVDLLGAEVDEPIGRLLRC